MTCADHDSGMRGQVWAKMTALEHRHEPSRCERILVHALCLLRDSPCSQTRSQRSNAPGQEKARQEKKDSTVR